MTESECYEKIESQLLIAMNKIDESLALMTRLMEENYSWNDLYEEASKMDKSKAILKEVLNSKFDKCARNNN